MYDSEHWECGYIDTGGCRHRYVRYTKQDVDEPRPVAAFSHGFSDNWKCLLPLARNFTENYDLFFYDTRAHGLTDAPDEGYDGPRLAWDFAALLDELQIKPHVVYGHSLGADTVLRAVESDLIEPDVVFLEDHPGQMFASDIIEYEEQRSKVQQWELMNHGDIRSKFLAAGIDEETADTLATARKQLRPEALNISYRGFKHLDEVCEKPDVPTFLLRPDPEIVNYLDTERDAEWEQAQEVTIEYVDGAGHTVFRDKPIQTLEEITAFLAFHDLPQINISTGGSPEKETTNSSSQQSKNIPQ